jgi:hypothetical protein
VYLDPDGRQSITINVTSCAEDGSCAAEQVAGSALPFLSPSQMATPEQAAALAESQARARLFGGGRADAPMVVQPMLASGAGQFERPHVEYGSSRQLSAMQSSADLDRALGLDPNYANYAQTTEAVGEMAFHSLPPVAVASGVHTMATAENGWQFAGGAMEATFGAAPFAAAARGPVAAWRAEMAASRATQQARPVAVSEGRSGATVVRFNDIDGEFRGDQILHPVGQRPPPADPQTYSVAYEMELLPRDLGRSRQVHANRAMAALDKSLRNDPEYAALMEATVPGVNSAVSPTGGRVTPTGWTWEHASTSTADGRVGVMRLVPSVQHTPGSPWWRALHPDPGAAGGYSEWAIPRGAPKNH